MTVPETLMLGYCLGVAACSFQWAYNIKRGSEPTVDKMTFGIIFWLLLIPVYAGVHRWFGSMGWLQ